MPDIVGPSLGTRLSKGLGLLFYRQWNTTVDIFAWELVGQIVSRVRIP